MTIIKNIHNTTSLKKVVPNKISVKEKWEHYKKLITQRLNGKTKHWKRKEQKQFLILFCTGFMALLILSFCFCFLPRQNYEGKSVTVPTLRTKLLLPEKQVPKTLRTPDPKMLPPPLLDSVAIKKLIFIHIKNKR